MMYAWKLSCSMFSYTAPAARYSVTALSSPATANCLPGASVPAPSGCHSTAHTAPAVELVETQLLVPTSQSLTVLSALLLQSARVGPRTSTHAPAP